VSTWSTADGGDLGVDVLVIGAGLAARYVAHSLHADYDVLVVDPQGPNEALDSTGYFSAGYDGNDVARIQPARRAAGYWGLWAESHGVEHRDADAWYVMAPDDESRLMRLWSDATLAVQPDGELPPILQGGSLDGRPHVQLVHDVVMNPADVLKQLSVGLEGRVLSGEVAKFGLITEEAVDFVEVALTDGRTVPISSRYVVIVADAVNGALLQRLVAVFPDRARRKEAVEVMRGCQAVRRVLNLAVRGSLPLVSGQFGELRITAHPYRGPGAGPDEVVWLVNPPIDDAVTVLGPEETRFDPAVDPIRVLSTIDALFAASPSVQRTRRDLRWGAWTARKTEHPMMATADTSSIAQPAPARLESLSFTNAVVGWPSHLAYAMIVGDVVAERVRTALGPRRAEGTGVPGAGEWTITEPLKARWDRDDFDWSDWSRFARELGYEG
jgi:hypothetical protein